eukprot:1462622-Prymnesium_polylepis.1
MSRRLPARCNAAGEVELVLPRPVSRCAPLDPQQLRALDEKRPTVVVLRALGRWIEGRPRH